LMAIADTCFIIDWARYSRREILQQLFDRVLIPRQVLDEVRAEATVSFIASGLARGWLAYYEPTIEVVREADDLVRRALATPGLRRIDLPEAVCLVLGRLMGLVVLTENLGALALARRLPELRGVEVWRSLEVLKEALRRGLLSGNPRDEVERFSRETRHVFREEEVEEVVRWLRTS